MQSLFIGTAIVASTVGVTTKTYVTGVSAVESTLGVAVSKTGTGCGLGELAGMNVGVLWNTSGVVVGTRVTADNSDTGVEVFGEISETASLNDLPSGRFVSKKINTKIPPASKILTTTISLLMMSRFQKFKRRFIKFPKAEVKSTHTCAGMFT